MPNIYDPNAAATSTPRTLAADNTTYEAKSSVFSRIVTYLSFIFIIPAILYITKRNNLIRQQSRLNEAASGIDVQLQNRRDTLVKLVDATKGAMKFEKDVLTKVTELRSMQIGNANRTQIDDQLSALSRNINIAFEAYPTLRSQDQVNSLMSSSYSIEQEIAATRRLYNANAREFNAGIMTWPGNVAAYGMKLSTVPMFVASAEDRRDVKVDLAV